MISFNQTRSKVDTRRSSAATTGNSHSARRFGISLIEMLVVIGLMGLLAALLLPGVVSVRERGRRLQCSQNLRQLLLAFHNYHGDYGVLPSQTLLSPPAHTYITARVFPYIGQPAWQPYLATAHMADRIQLLMCPSDSYPTSTVRPINYLVNTGPSFPSYRDDGIVGNVYNPDASGLSLAAFSDGLSNTAAISERVATHPTSLTQTTASPAIQYGWNINPSGLTGTVADNEIFVSHCETGVRILAQGAPGEITSWSGNVATNFGRYTHAMQPNTPSCVDPRPSLYSPWVSYYIAAQSLHWSGVNVGMVDGSVRFVSDAVDRSVWRATGTRASSDGSSVSNQ